ncbi:MAG: hypothetical protein U9N57_02500 [Pseudomonadota bacterium]|nr:hypothetical protein [Pseudomonadota bacterium]
MERSSLNEWQKRTYKPPTNIEATNKKLDPDKVKKAKRINEHKERIQAKQDSWDALEEK